MGSHSSDAASRCGSAYLLALVESARYDATILQDTSEGAFRMNETLAAYPSAYSEAAAPDKSYGSGSIGPTPAVREPSLTERHNDISGRFYAFMSETVNEVQALKERVAWLESRVG